MTRSSLIDKAVREAIRWWDAEALCNNILCPACLRSIRQHVQSHWPRHVEENSQ